MELKKYTKPVDIPSPKVYDALTVLQTLVTKVTTFNGAGFNLKTQTPRRGMVARILVSNYSCTATGAVLTFSIDKSSDNTTYYTYVEAEPLTLGTAAANKEIFIRFSTTKEWIRVSSTLSVATGAPTVSYLADLGISNP